MQFFSDGNTRSVEDVGSGRGKGRQSSSKNRELAAKGNTMGVISYNTSSSAYQPNYYQDGQISIQKHYSYYTKK